MNSFGFEEVLQEKENQIDELEDELIQLKKELFKEQVNSSSFQQEIEELKEQLHEQKNKVEDIENKARTSIQKNDGDDSKIKVWKESFKNSQIELKRLKNELKLMKEKENQVQILNQELEEKLRLKKGYFDAELEGSSQREDELRRRISILEEENKALIEKQIIVQKENSNERRLRNQSEESLRLTRESKDKLSFELERTTEIYEKLISQMKNSSLQYYHLQRMNLQTKRRLNC